MAPRKRVKDTTSPISPISDAPPEELLRRILGVMKDQGLSFTQLSKLYYSDEITVPAEIFAKNLSPSEAVCTYLKENRRLSFHAIAAMLRRDDRSVWTSYHRGMRKQKKPFSPATSRCIIPVSVLANRQYSFLESIILYLSKQDMKPSAIAKLLHRAAPIIYTVLGRARKKEEKNKEKKEGT